MTRKTDYEQIATTYDRRYRDNTYSGTDDTLRGFVTDGQRVLEVGCGTGHWLARLEHWGCQASGLDPSSEMLKKAAARGLKGQLVRGRAESLPWADAAFDRVVCVNALHHFGDKAGFATEARRVLCRGGRVLSIALDPGAGADRWYIYDYFQDTFALDHARYPRTAVLRDWFTDAGFVGCDTVVAEHITVDEPARELLDSGRLAKSVTSQLAILSDAEYKTGLDHIWRDIHTAEAHGNCLRLTADLRLYATYGEVP